MTAPCMHFFIDPQNGDDRHAELRPNYCDDTPQGETTRSRYPLKTFAKLGSLLTPHPPNRSTTVHLLSDHTDPKDAPRIHPNMTLVGERREPPPIPDVLIPGGRR